MNEQCERVQREKKSCDDDIQTLEETIFRCTHNIGIVGKEHGTKCVYVPCLANVLFLESPSSFLHFLFPYNPARCRILLGYSFLLHNPHALDSNFLSLSLKFHVALMPLFQKHSSSFCLRLRIRKKKGGIKAYGERMWRGTS